MGPASKLKAFCLGHSFTSVQHVLVFLLQATVKVAFSHYTLKGAVQHSYFGSSVEISGLASKMYRLASHV